jgi:hypothetical protein
MDGTKIAVSSNAPQRDSGADHGSIRLDMSMSSWPGLSRPSTSYFCGAKNVDHRDIGAKQSFVASPGDDDKWMPTRSRDI